MWATLLSKISDTLDTVTLVKESFCVPKDDVKKYPAVFFKPAGFQNSFATTSENAQVYRFLLLVMVGANGTNNSPSIAFGTTLPKVVDAITTAFDQGWDYGTVSGHRVRIKIDSADEWQLSEEDDGLVAYAPINLEIKLLKSV